MTEHVECVVVGAGVVGLAVARELALAGREVIMLEAADAIGTETSSRNSEVIHAGIYYPPGSLKAELCVAGKRALYDYCRERGIAHSRCGKLVAATAPEQIATLDEIARRAAANGVDDLAWLAPSEVAGLEPELSCAAALLSPSSGIVDSHALMLSLQGDAESHGAAIALQSPLRGGRATGDGFLLEVGPDDAPLFALACWTLVNCAGLHAQEVAARIEGLPPEAIPPRYLAKGNYYALTGRTPFRRLIYPVPEEGGLGVHVTLDLAGRARFGPDVEWVDRISYEVDPRRADAFYAAIRRYWPALPDGALVPDYAGMRTKLGPPGSPAADFLIQGPAEHGVPGLVNLFGVESPGLTAALAIGVHVARLVG
jgi:L-2-hydroxyglutarate oxidase LhgO